MKLTANFFSLALQSAHQPTLVEDEHPVGDGEELGKL